MTGEQDEPLLRVRDLRVTFGTDGGLLRALDDVSFDVPVGSAVALVGESGCGKSVTALSILGLIPQPGKIDAGEILFEGRDLRALPEREMQSIRGARIAMVFQEPMTSLNPVYTIGAQIGEAVRLHRPVSRAQARARALEVLTKVGFPRPEERIDAYPHELSGGMRQRVMIAMALACDPPLLIADEPTTALDVTIQAQIIDLLAELRRESNMSLLLIAHDLAVVAEVAEQLVVLYAGEVVERGATAEVLASPNHPYTRALLRSIPPTDRLTFRVRGKRGTKLPTVGGTLPDLRHPPLGCAFQERCPDAFDRCRDERPPLYRVSTDRSARCFLHAPGAVDAARSPAGDSAR